MSRLIRIIQIDMDAFIEKLVSDGETRNDIVYTLYDCRINGIDTIEKAEHAYDEWVTKQHNKE